MIVFSLVSSRIQNDWKGESPKRTSPIHKDYDIALRGVPSGSPATRQLGRAAHPSSSHKRGCPILESFFDSRVGEHKSQKTGPGVEYFRHGRVAHPSSSHKPGCPILESFFDSRVGEHRSQKTGPGVEYFRHGETCPLPAVRLFPLSDFQLLSAVGVVGRRGGVPRLRARA